MEMIDRYIYAVTQKLPQRQREDIAKELRGLIADMLEERVQNNMPTAQDIEAVLMELGDPRILAQKYRGTKKYIIGPELFDGYLWSLKYILIAVSIGISVSFIVQTVMDPTSILEHFVEIIISFFTVIPMVIGWLTIVFAIIQYYEAENMKEYTKGEPWKPSNLAQIPDPKRQIKRCEAIAGIVFYTIVMVLFTFLSDYFGIMRFKEDKLVDVINFLNEETFSIYLPFVFVILGLSIFKEALKIITGKWTPKLVLNIFLINTLTLVAVYFMIEGSGFWNPNFMQELSQSGIVSQGSEGFETISRIWNSSTRWILIIFLVGLVWDAIDGLIKYRKAMK